MSDECREEREVSENQHSIFLVKDHESIAGDFRPQIAKAICFLQFFPKKIVSST
jgi:hypothetical protein